MSIAAVEGNKYYIFCVSVALVIQHAMHMCHILWSSVVCLSPPHFFTLSHRRDAYQKNVTE